MRNRVDKNIIFALFISVVAHILFFTMILIPHNLNSKGRQKEHVVVTRLVALGLPRDEKVMPRITAGTSEPEKEVIINTNSSNEISPSEKKEKRDERRQDEFSKKILSSISKVKKMLDVKDPSLPQGDPNGSPYGDSAEGRKGDIYLTEIYNRIRANYVIPDIINEKQRKELLAVIIIYIDEGGRLIKTEFEKRSGNSHFDNALLNAIKRSSPFKSPPKERAKEYKTTGIGINFSIE